MLLAGIAACGGRAADPAPAGPAERPPPAPAPLAEVYLLESWGVPAEDTVVVVPGIEPRVVLVRRGPPDNSVFAELRLPGGALLPPAGQSSTTLTLTVRPGVFGLELALEPGATLAAPAELLFSYAVHFVMPEAARTRFSSAIEFEQSLFVGQLGADNIVRFLPSRRPASDVLVATIRAPGTYVVAAPR